MSYSAAIYFYIKIPYIRDSIGKASDAFKPKSTEGLVYMLKRPAMFLFLFFSIMPFIGVMLTNYLFPVYLADVLKVSGSFYGIQSMVYGVGAVVAGIVVPIIARKLGDERTIISSVITYTIAISFIIVTNIPFYLSLTFLIALGNSGARVARNSFLMDRIPNEIIGRVDSLFRTIGLLLRIILLAIFTGMVSTGLIIYCFMILSGILIISSIFVTVSWRNGFETKGKATKLTMKNKLI